ncbi:MAG: hypothetical protein R3C14_15345 [Caldilineaceae bacterium]|nr:hypothetical protein [Caldilineaceae bacterium]
MAERIQEIKAMVKNPPESALAWDSTDATGLTGKLAAIRSKLYLWQNDHQKARARNLHRTGVQQKA